MTTVHSSRARRKPQEPEVSKVFSELSNKSIARHEDTCIWMSDRLVDMQPRTQGNQFTRTPAQLAVHVVNLEPFRDFPPGDLFPDRTVKVLVTLFPGVDPGIASFVDSARPERCSPKPEGSY